MNRIEKAKAARATCDAMAPPFSPDDLKTIRASFDFSQAQFARLLRVEKSWVTKREQGVNRMTASDTALYQAILHMRGHKCLVDWMGES